MNARLASPVWDDIVQKDVKKQVADRQSTRADTAVDRPITDTGVWRPATEPCDPFEDDEDVATIHSSALTMVEWD